MANSEMDNQPFQGIWSTDTFGVLRLEQNGLHVTGHYTRPLGGIIEGSAQGRRLIFTWHDQPGESGQGFLRILPKTSTMAGLWKYATNKTQCEGIFAEPIDASVLSSASQPISHNRVDLKYQGLKLISQGRFLEAIAPLEEALQLYSVDSDLIGEAQVLSYLRDCYYHVADYGILQEEPQLSQRRDDFYDRLLLYLQEAVETYRQRVQKVVKQYVTEPLKKTTHVADTLDWCAQQLTNRLATEEATTHELKTSHARLSALAIQLQTWSQALTEAEAKLRQMETSLFGAWARFGLELTSLDHVLADIQQLARECVDSMEALTKSWPANEQKYCEALTPLLTLLIFEIASKRRMIVRLSESLTQNVQGTQESLLHLATVLEQWRERLFTDRSKILALDKGKTFFQRLIQILVDLGGEQEALLFSEEARARAFVDLLASKAAISDCEQHSAADVAQLLNPLHAPSITQATLIEIVKQHNSTTIEYFIAERSLLIWVITPDGVIRMCQSAISEQEMDTQVHRLFDLLKCVQRHSLTLAEEQSNKKDVAEFALILEQLYTYLVAPIPVEWLPVSPAESLTIIPHGPLFLVPFAALRRGNVNFVEEHATVLAPSIHLLSYTAEQLRRVPHLDQPNLLALVNPAPLPEGNFTPLAVTEQLAPELLSYYAHTEQNLCLIGPSAGKDALFRSAAHYNTLLFATHGEVCDGEPLQSYLVLACVPPDDGYVCVSDIYRLELCADLVLLSACETGRGTISGDGVLGLSRAFLYAGACSVLMSLWQIPEKVSMWQVDLFHQYWREEGMSKGRALWETQRSFCQEYPDRPDLWAGFVLFGEGQ
jgi:CHAT domain-containing protein